MRGRQSNPMRGEGVSAGRTGARRRVPTWKRLFGEDEGSEGLAAKVACNALVSAQDSGQEPASPRHVIDLPAATPAHATGGGKKPRVSIRQRYVALHDRWARLQSSALPRGPNCSESDAEEECETAPTLQAEWIYLGEHPGPLSAPMSQSLAPRRCPDRRSLRMRILAGPASPGPQSCTGPDSCANEVVQRLSSLPHYLSSESNGIELRLVFKDKGLHMISSTRKFVLLLKHGSKARAFKFWNARISQQIQVRTGVEKVIQKMINFSHVFSAIVFAWSCFASRRQLLKRKLHRRSKGQQRKVAQWGLRILIMYAYHKRESRTKMQKTMADFKHRNVDKCFKRWQYQLKLKVEILQISAQMAKCQLRLIIAHGLKRWHKNVRQKQVMAMKTRRVRERSSRMMLKSFVRLWAHLAALLAHNGQIVRQNASQMLTRVMMMTFQVWDQAVRILQVERAEETKRHRLMFSIWKRMLARKTSLAFFQWRKQLTESKSITAKACQIILRWKNHARACRFQRWLGILHRAHKARAEQDRLNVLMHAIVKRMLNRILAGTWNRWCEGVAEVAAERMEQKRRRHTISRIVHRMFNRVLSGAWECWRAGVKKQIEDRLGDARRNVIGSKIVIRVLQRSLYAAWEKWCQNVQDIAAERVDEAYRQNVTTKILKRKHRSCLQWAWMCWHQHVSDIIFERAGDEWRQRMCTKIVRKTLQISVSLALYRWNDNVKELRKMTSRVHKLTARWKIQASSKSFYLWFQHVEVETQLILKCQQIIRKLNLRVTRKCVNAWIHGIQEEINDQIQMMQKYQKIIQRLMHHTIRKCMYMWKQSTVEGLMNRSDTKRRRRLMSIIMNRILRSRVWSAFSRWLQNTNEQRAFRTNANKFVLRLKRHIRACFFQRWLEILHLEHEARAEQDRLNVLMHAIVKRMLNRTLAGTWNRWREGVTEIAAEQLEEKRKRHTIFRWMHRASGDCLTAWREHTAEEGRKRTLMGRVVRRLQQRGMAVVWGTWQRRVEEALAERQIEERRQHIMAKVVTRIRNQGLVSAFLRWAVCAAQASQKRRVMRKASVQMCKRRLSGAYDQWLEGMRGLRTTEVGHLWDLVRVKTTFDSVKRTVARMAFSLIGHAFEQWHEVVETAKEKFKVQMERAMLRTRRNALVAKIADETSGRCSQKDSDRGSEQKSLERILLLAATFETFRVFDVWRRWISDMKLREKHMKKHATRRLQSIKSSVCMNWRVATIEKIAARSC